MARANKYRDLVKQGLCVSCGKRKPSEGLRICDVCKEGQTKRNLKYRNKLKELGLCLKCGKEKAVTKTLCSKCRIIQNEINKKRYQAAKAQRAERERLGICVSCGKRPATEKSKYCSHCQGIKQRYENRHREKRRNRDKN